METLKFIQSLENKTLTAIRSSFYNKGILANYNSDGRMILYMSKTQRFNKISKTDQLLFNECNGLIIDAINLKILVLPPQSFRSNVDTAIVSDYLSKDLYDIFLIEDGTTINLYYWEPTSSWCIATARSYDSTNSKWGQITYSEIIKELLLNNNIPDIDFYNTLDKNTSYTFGIKHASMHPFREGLADPINKLWFIQSCKDNVISYELLNDTLNIKHQPKLDKTALLHNQEFTTKYMFGTLKHSLANFIQSGYVLYGYILRSKDTNKTGTHNSILLESSLLQQIRKLYYHSSFNNISVEKNYNRENFTVIYAYLDVNTHTTFIKLFPQYLEIYKKLHTTTGDLVKNIISYIDTKTLNNVVQPNGQINISKVIEFIYKSITNQFNIIPYDNRNVQIVSSFLLNINNAGLYYSLLFPS